MTPQEIRGERRVAREHVVARVRGHIAIEVWIVAEEFVRDTAPNDRTGRIRSLVVIISAHIRPERVGMTDERRLGVGLQHALETPGESRAPGTFLLEVIDFLKMD